MINNTGLNNKSIMVYLIAMNAYRAFYILNWIYRYETEGFYDLIAIFGGIVQVMVYLVFFFLKCIMKANDFDTKKSQVHDLNPKSKTKLVISFCFLNKEN
jgi:hypothetical protein